MSVFSRKSPIYRIVIAQFIATLLASASCLVIDKVAAFSALLGGLVCVVPGCFVLLMSSRLHTSSLDANAGIGLALKGEAGKFALSIILFALVFVMVKPINVLTFFGTFIGLQLFYVIVPLVNARRLFNYPAGNRKS